MIKKLLYFILCLIFPILVKADVVVLTAMWDPPSAYSEVREYNLWVGNSPTGLFTLHDEFLGGITNQSTFVVDMIPGETKYFELTAMYIDGEESDPSNMAVYTHPLPTPQPDPPTVKEAPKNLVVTAL